MSLRITHFNGLAAGFSIFADVTVSTSTTSGQLVTVQNPEEVPVYVEKAVVCVTTGSTAACTLNVGIASTSTSSDNLMDGVDVNVVPIGLYDNITDKGTNGSSRVYMAAGDYFTASVASGDANGLVARIACRYSLASGGP